MITTAEKQVLSDEIIVLASRVRDAGDRSAGACLLACAGALVSNTSDLLLEQVHPFMLAVQAAMDEAR